MRTAAAVPFSTRAIVLRVRPLGEKDRLVTLLTEDRGKIGTVAKGARGPRARLGALAQTFVRGRFLIATGRSLHIITQAEIEENHSLLSLDMLRLGWASLAVELADGLEEGVPDHEAWEIVAVTLGHLNAFSPEDTTPGKDVAAEATGAWFLAHWLRHQGYSPTIGHCVNCGIKVTPAPQRTGEAAVVGFSPAMGGTLCSACTPVQPGRLIVDADALRTWHRLQKSLQPPAALDITGSCHRDLFSCLFRSLQQNLDRRLKAQEFLDEVRTARSLKVPY